MDCAGKINPDFLTPLLFFSDLEMTIQQIESPQNKVIRF